MVNTQGKEKTYEIKRKVVDEVKSTLMEVEEASSNPIA